MTYTTRSVTVIDERAVHSPVNGDGAANAAVQFSLVALGLFVVLYVVFVGTASVFATFLGVVTGTPPAFPFLLFAIVGAATGAVTLSIPFVRGRHSLSQLMRFSLVFYVLTHVGLLAFGLAGYPLHRWFYRIDRRVSVAYVIGSYAVLALSFLGAYTLVYRDGFGQLRTWLAPAE